MKIIISLFFIFLIAKNIYIKLNYKFLAPKKQRLIIRIILFNKILIFKKQIEKNNNKKNVNFELIRDAIIKGGIYKETIKNIRLKIIIGTENILLTTYSIPIISTVIAIIINKYIKNKEECYFEVKPVLKEENLLKINLQVLFKIKLIHIIKIVCYILKEKREKHGKASNRKSYGYCNAKH